MLTDPWKYKSFHFSPYVPCSVSSCEWFSLKRIDRCDYYVDPPRCRDYKPQRKGVPYAINIHQ